LLKILEQIKKFQPQQMSKVSKSQFKNQVFAVYLLYKTATNMLLRI